MATVNLGRIKFVWQGAYSGATAYVADDVVSYNGSSYICILASTNNLPTNTTYWNLMAQSGTDITSLAGLAQGDVLYYNGTSWVRLGAGTSGQFLKTNGSGANPAWATLSDSFGSQLLNVRDEKASGTTGGNFTSGSWHTRTLNTVKTNEISGASLASNQITLPSGTYYIDASAPAFYVGINKLKLANITDSSDTIIGQVAKSGRDQIDEYSISATLSGRFTIAAQKVFELQHRCSSSDGNGYGYFAGYSVVEVYAEAKIWKVA